MVPYDPERKIDAWLDEALARYSVAEPRAGLEKRVLESLRAEKRGPYRPWWKAWAPALATAAAGIILMAVMVRHRDFPPGRAVTQEIAPAQTPAVPAATPAGERRPESSAGSRSPAKTEEPGSLESTGAVPAPGANTAASALMGSGEPGSAKGGNRIARGAGAAPRVALNPHPMRTFPRPAPLGEQERLAMAAGRNGLLSSAEPRNPPGDEPLPQVVIQEIAIRPFEEIEPI